MNITDESDDSDDIARHQKYIKKNKYTDNNWKGNKEFINVDISNNKPSYQKPKYLQEKERRERESPIKHEEKPRKRERKEQKKSHRQRQLSEEEAELPNLDDLGIKVEERNNQIMFDVSLFN